MNDTRSRDVYVTFSAFFTSGGKSRRSESYDISSQALEPKSIYFCVVSEASSTGIH